MEKRSNRDIETERQWHITQTNTASDRPHNRPAFDMAPDVCAIDQDAQWEDVIIERNALGEIKAPNNNVSATLREGDTLHNNRYKIIGIVGGGTFGQIYAAQDGHYKNRLCIIKTGLRVREKDCARFLLEVEVTRLLIRNKSQHAPRLYSCGQVLDHTPPYNYMCMELLSKSLEDLRRAASKNHFSLSTSMHLWIFMMTSIRDFHRTGYIHRDIKPSNMVMGLGDRSRTFFLIDFGLARLHFDINKPQQVRVERMAAGFRGTARYVSARVHFKKDQCRADDMIALFYSFMEMLTGYLPWKNHRDQRKLRDMKTKFDVIKHCPPIPKQFDMIYQELLQLEYDHCPRYQVYIDMTKEAMALRKIKFRDVFDWEKPEFGQHRSSRHASI